MDAVVTVLQAAAAVATILLCGFVIYAVWRLRGVADTLDDSGKKLLDNLSALSGMAHEREIPLRVSDTLEGIKKTADDVAESARNLSQASAAVRDFFGNEKAKAVPPHLHELLTQGEELAADLRKTSEQLRATIAAPGEAMARLSGGVGPMLADARKKMVLVRTFLDALRTGVTVSWDELHKPDEEGGEGQP
jgi:uncharacterized protein YoxC